MAIEKERGDAGREYRTRYECLLHSDRTKWKKFFISNKRAWLAQLLRSLPYEHKDPKFDPSSVEI